MPQLPGLVTLGVLAPLVRLEKRDERAGKADRPPARPAVALHRAAGIWPHAHGIAIDDVTGDGRKDLVVTAGGNIPDSRLLVYRQTTTGLFSSPVVYPVRDIPQPVVLADINEDGRNVMAHGGWQQVGVILQRTRVELAGAVRLPRGPARVAGRVHAWPRGKAVEA
jgi:hypothetical protein